MALPFLEPEQLIFCNQGSGKSWSCYSLVFGESGSCYSLICGESGLCYSLGCVESGLCYSLGFGGSGLSCCLTVCDMLQSGKSLVWVMYCLRHYSPGCVQSGLYHSLDCVTVWVVTVCFLDSLGYVNSGIRVV